MHRECSLVAFNLRTYLAKYFHFFSFVFNAEAVPCSSVLRVDLECTQVALCFIVGLTIYFATLYKPGEIAVNGEAFTVNSRLTLSCAQSQ